MDKKKSNKLISWVEDKNNILEWKLPKYVLNDLNDLNVKRLRIDISAEIESNNILAAVDSTKINRMKKLQSIDESRLVGFFLSKGSIKKSKLKVNF